MSTSSIFGGISQALANPRFRLFWIANGTATIGRWVYRTAVMWLAWDLTKSTTWLGAMAFADVFPMIVLSVFAGAISDRAGYVRVIKLSQLGMCLMGATFSGAIYAGYLSIGLILGISIVHGILEAMSTPARIAIVHALVKKDELSAAIALNSAMFNASRVLGPAIGGLLAPSLDGSWPAAALFGATLSAYIEPFGYGIPMLLAAAMAAINFGFASWALAEPERHETRDASASRLEVLRNPAMRRFCILNLIFSLAVTQLETIFAYFMIDRFHFDAMNVAFILVGMAVLMGGVQGGAIRPLAARFGERTLAVSGFSIMAASLLAIPFMPTVGWVLLPLALSAIGRGIGQPPILSLVSMAASPSERGSVLGTFQSSASLARVLGPAAAGALYALYQGGPFVLAAGLMFVAFLLAIRLPKVREFESN